MCLLFKHYLTFTERIKNFTYGSHNWADPEIF